MTLQPGETPNVVDPHSQKGIQLRIQQQAAIIRNWATEQNFVEGQDYLVTEDITDHLEEGDEGWPHERRMFYMEIRDTHYARSLLSKFIRSQNNESEEL